MQLAIPTPAVSGNPQHIQSADPHQSAVAWGAIFAGAAAAAALSLILLVLGTGLGLAVLSPWSSSGQSAERLGWASIVWITLTAITASGLGGYLTGRLRVRWAGTAVDEVYFRDTAHGLLAWAIATLATAALLGAAIGTILGGGARIAATGVGAAAPALSGAAVSDQRAPASLLGYFAARMLRAEPAAEPAATVPPTAVAGPGDQREVQLILANAWTLQSLSDADADWLAQRLAVRQGISQAAARSRVQAVWTDLQERRAALRDLGQQARKVAAHSALWLFISLLGGAFMSSWLATVGGRQRDL